MKQGRCSLCRLTHPLMCVCFGHALQAICNSSRSISAPSKRSNSRMSHTSGKAMCAFAICVMCAFVSLVVSSFHLVLSALLSTAAHPGPRSRAASVSAGRARVLQRSDRSVHARRLSHPPAVRATQAVGGGPTTKEEEGTGGIDDVDRHLGDTRRTHTRRIRRTDANGRRIDTGARGNDHRIAAGF